MAENTVGSKLLDVLTGRQALLISKLFLEQPTSIDNLTDADSAALLAAWPHKHRKINPQIAPAELRPLLVAMRKDSVLPSYKAVKAGKRGASAVAESTP